MGRDDLCWKYGSVNCIRIKPRIQRFQVLASAQSSVKVKVIPVPARPEDFLSKDSTHSG